MGNNENIISDDMFVSEKSKTFFKIPLKFISNEQRNEVLDPVDKVISKYKNHPNILTIKTALSATTLNFFSEVSLSDI